MNTATSYSDGNNYDYLNRVPLIIVQKPGFGRQEYRLQHTVGILRLYSCRNLLADFTQKEAGPVGFEPTVFGSEGRRLNPC
jgi:hypothetical protein